MPQIRLWSSLALLAFVFGCHSLHQAGEYAETPALVEAEYHFGRDGDGPRSRWWEAFQDEALTTAVDEALQHNADLGAAWERIAQSRALVQASGAALLPAIDLTSSVSALKQIEAGVPEGIFVGGAPGGADTTSIAIGPRLSYELDVWGRVREGREARGREYAASIEDYLATATVVGGEVTEAFVDLLAQRELQDILEKQIVTNRKQLDLIELRFSAGQSSSLDVFQQRQQLARTESDRPIFQRDEELALNRLALLCGRTTGQLETMDRRQLSYELPAFPRLGSPAELIELRPDLRAARNRLRAADHDVAVAVAERLPRLDFSLSYDFVATRVGANFDREVINTGLSLLAPLFDNGRRQADVERNKARVRELLQSYRGAFLTAIREVEDALVNERRQLERMAAIERERDLAIVAYKEARRSYVGGLSDFLDVTTSLQTRQVLERSVVLEKRLLMIFRIRLYRALGGAGLNDLVPRVIIDDELRP